MNRRYFKNKIARRIIPKRVLENRYMLLIRTFFWHLRNNGLRKAIRWLSYRLQSRLARIYVPSFDSLNLQELSPNRLPVSFADMQVACILDEFSMHAWACEFRLLPVDPGGWKESFKSEIDFLFVESAWAGNNGSWRYHLTGGKAPSRELIDLVSKFRRHNIPTVFWNKEDPPHFDDFIETAKLFDVVFTSDSNIVEKYKQALPSTSVVDVMSFAAQPSIHSPVRAAGMYRTGDVAFAGMYFAHKFESRRRQMDLILGAASNVAERFGIKFVIYSRFEGSETRYQFPEPFSNYVVGSLPYQEMLTAYHMHKVFLNVNTVDSSPSMCARRVFEISASGAVVVSTPSVALPEFFNQDEVPVVSSKTNAISWLRALVQSPELRDKVAHRAQRRIWSSHTYTHRASQIVDVLGLDHPDPGIGVPSVSAILVSKRPENIESAIRALAEQKSVDLQIQLLTHGFEIPDGLLKRLRSDFGSVDIQPVSAPEAWSLGRCLNHLIDRADGDFCAKIDDDDFYADRYLQDQINALRYSGADLVGKEAAYMYLGGSNTLMLRRPEREHQFTHFVAGPTLVAAKGLFTDNQFEDRTFGEDTQLLKDILRRGGSIYSSDRFNFIQVRGNHNHTWAADELEMLASGVVHSFGFNKTHVIV